MIVIKACRTAGNLLLLFILMLGSFSGMAQTAKPRAVQVGKVIPIARITGKSLPSDTIPNSNRTVERWDIGGTDLGIAWRMGNGRTGLWFGDTYGADWKVSPEGGPGQAGNWRSNVLAFSSDEELDDGIAFDDMLSLEIIPSPHITDGTGNHTTIPTAAIHAHGKDYVHYMEVRQWGTPGSWTTNRSGLYSSADQGRTWIKSDRVEFDGGSHFAQAAYARHEGYVYMLGTPSGRWGGVYLSRFKESDIENKKGYAYWDGQQWQAGQESLAAPLIPAPAGELSLIWHEDFQRWMVTYLNEKKHALVLRSAATITGPWSEEQILARGDDYPGLYGAFIHPASTRGDTLYFLMSMWKPYNVFLLKAELNFQ